MSWDIKKIDFKGSNIINFSYKLKIMQFKKQIFMITVSLSIINKNIHCQMIYKVVFISFFHGNNYRLILNLKEYGVILFLRKIKNKTEYVKLCDISQNALYLSLILNIFIDVIGH